MRQLIINMLEQNRCVKIDDDCPRHRTFLLNVRSEIRTGKFTFIFESKLKSLSFLKEISIESLIPYSNKMRKKFSNTLCES